MSKILTIAALKDLLTARKGCTFVTIVTATKPKVLKKDRETGEPNPFGQIVKVSRVNGLIGFRYENSVNNQRTREGSEADFEAGPRAWGEHVTAEDGHRTPMVANKGRTYLEIKVERSLDPPTYHDAQGHPVAYAACKGVLPARKPESARQELDSEVILRDYALDSVREISMDGEKFMIVS